MLIEVIEKKGKPVQTKISFTKKEWNSIPPGIQGEFVLLGVVETARKVYFMIDGDLLNNKDTMGEKIQEAIKAKRRKSKNARSNEHI